MSFADELAAFRAAHPHIDQAEVFVIDLNGIARGKLIPLDALGKIENGGLKLPSATPLLDVFSEDVYETGLAIQTGDPDGVVDVVAGSLRPMLWADPPCAQAQVTIRRPDGSPAGFDGRNVLAGVIDRAHASGLRPVLALELEFFLIDPRKPRPPVNPVAGGRLSAGQVYDLDITRAFAPVTAKIAEAAAALGAPIESQITEFGFGQFEVNLAHHDDPLRAADQIVALRRAIRGVARAEGLDATFMAKPWGDTTGSGLHLHMSILDSQNNNVFSGMDDTPAPALRHAIRGMLDHMAEAMLIFAPHLNSYRRFVPGYIAPVEALWGLDHRAAAIRVPETTGKGARFEHRVAGSDANPYLVTAAILASALAGIEAGREPPEPISGELMPGMGSPLPPDWGAAERLFAESAFIGDWLGTEFRDSFAAIKRQERVALMMRVSDVEHEVYLRRL